MTVQKYVTHTSDDEKFLKHRILNINRRRNHPMTEDLPTTDYVDVCTEGMSSSPNGLTSAILLERVADSVRHRKGAEHRSNQNLYSTPENIADRSNEEALNLSATSGRKSDKTVAVKSAVREVSAMQFMKNSMQQLQVITAGPTSSLDSNIVPGMHNLL